MAGMSLDRFVVPEPEDLIPLPFGSNLYMLPDRPPVGYDPRRDRFVTLEEYRGRPVYAAAAFMAPAHLQLLRAACRSPAGMPPLPLYSYTALGWREGGFCAAGLRIDPDRRQDPQLQDLEEIERRAPGVLRRYPGNRLVAHLIERCVLCYGCPAARNFVMGRWECPVPTSSACNARCVGCISHQDGASGVPSSQERLEFTPTVREVSAFTVPHLKRAPRAVISFGQGCEGEPLLQGELLEESIRAVRRATDRGVINLNTNGSRPEVLERLCRAGLDSVRVSLNSAQRPCYQAYYRPRGYSFEEVVESLRVARRHGIWSSLNYLVFPGFSDHPAEMAALERLVRDAGVNMIQTRNLNIDPEWYIRELGLAAFGGERAGMRGWVRLLRERLPRLKLGYFNPPREEMHPRHYPARG